MKRMLLFLYKIKIFLLSRYYLLFPCKGTYRDLYRYKDVFGPERYVSIRNRIFARSTKAIRAKQHKKIRFMLSYAGEWCATDIYRYFDQRGIDVAVVLVPYFDRSQEDDGQEFVRKHYARNREFCQSKGLRYIDAYDTDDFRFIGQMEDVRGDIVIYLRSWMALYSKETSLYHLPLSSVACYIPYGFMILKSHIYQFNQMCHNMFARIYCESEMHRQLFGQYCDIGNSHVEFSGHPKMDPFFVEDWPDDHAIWKGLDQEHDKLKIIYSPHWNFANGWATFMDNAAQIQEYAATHPDTTSWIYKPHPNLEKEIVCSGRMSAQDYRAYVSRWEDLPNARVYLTGDYTDIFKTSDCIINDSISFISEYMYTHKPMLLLLNETNKGYNEYGQQAASQVYACRGNDFESIVKFIENVRDGKDEMKPAREEFFNANLNYYRIRGQLAGEYIALQIADMMGV